MIMRQKTITDAKGRTIIIECSKVEDGYNLTAFHNDKTIGVFNLRLGNNVLKITGMGLYEGYELAGIGTAIVIFTTDLFGKELYDPTIDYADKGIAFMKRCIEKGLID